LSFLLIQNTRQMIKILPGEIKDVHLKAQHLADQHKSNVYWVSDLREIMKWYYPRR